MWAEEYTYLTSIKQWMKDKPEFIGNSIRLQIALEMPYSLWDNLSNIQDNILYHKMVKTEFLC